MKRFDAFGDYMYYLLIAPFKKVKQKANQFYIFFKVIGRIFDSIKQDFFKVRTEVSVLTASHEMLHVHGQDRGMSRLEGEDMELFRRRLLMKGIVAAQAGTKEGIVSLIKSMGYETVRLEPLYLTDPARWAEATVWISGGSVVIEDRDIIQREINKIKPGTNLIALAQEQVFDGTVYMGTATGIFKIIDVKQV